MPYIKNNPYTRTFLFERSVLGEIKTSNQLLTLFQTSHASIEEYNDHEEK
jgi:hypothetical protein